ncbi:hypothetical protein [Pseudoteredinibacter isoporae]|uniref:hypothetical protein n=1 Tax=Pseudoteredinibacter isoporae TaxID=570281 RepID=UPI003104C75F
MSVRLFCFLLVAAIASGSAFVVHVITVEWLPAWIALQMEGKSISPAWDVRYVAMLSSIEYGLAVLLIYHFMRDKLIARGFIFAIFILFALLAASHGDLIWQPAMDYVVGNPALVVVVQNGFKYLTWFLMSLITVWGYEFINRKFFCE